MRKGMKRKEENRDVLCSFSHDDRSGADAERRELAKRIDGSLDWQTRERIAWRSPLTKDYAERGRNCVSNGYQRD